MIDLRSDTVTKPTDAMRQAMATAEVGDDVLGDDPTVAELERATAQVLGKEAALYVPSGTMGNQLALRTLTEPGDEILLDAKAHMYLYEAGAPAALSGVMCHLLGGVRGVFTAGDVRAALRPGDVHFPRTKLLCVENTHNRGGGSIWPIEAVREVHDAAREAKLATYLDGARIWNASVATGIAEKDYARYFDAVSVCFSKGLGAPVGSALAGSGEFIARARRFRKMFGGGMRQAGIIAAGALYALRHHRSRLADDHANARALAAALAEIPRLSLDPPEVATNMVFLRLDGLDLAGVVRRLADAGVLVLATSDGRIRAVTNLMVSADDVGRAGDLFRDVIGAGGES